MKKKLLSKFFIIQFFSIFLSILFTITLVKAENRPKPISLGDENAPVTLYEFFSFSCSHCGDFHLNTLPKLTTDYIDKKLVKIVFIDVPMGGEVILFAHSLVYQFKNNKTAENFSSLLFSNQISWLTSNNPNDQLIKFAKLSGLNDSQIMDAKNNKLLQQSLIQSAKSYQEKLKITGTPSIVLVKGKQNIFGKDNELIIGNIPYDNLKSKIDNFLKIK